MMVISFDISDEPEAEELANLLLEAHESVDDYRLFIIAHFKERLSAIFLNTYENADMAVCGESSSEISQVCEQPHSSHRLSPKRGIALREGADCRGEEPVMLSPQQLLFIGRMITEHVE